MILKAVIFLILLIYLNFKKQISEQFQICDVPYRIDGNCFDDQYNRCLLNHYSKKECVINSQRSCVVPVTISSNFPGFFH